MADLSHSLASFSLYCFEWSALKMWKNLLKYIGFDLLRSVEHIELQIYLNAIFEVVSRLNDLKKANTQTKTKQSNYNFQ